MTTQHVCVELYREVDDAGTPQQRWTIERDPDDATASAAYARDAITISHGRGPEQGEPTPSSATLTFKGHEYNPENPASALYGLIGPNTPLRISTGLSASLADEFTRSVTNGWNGANGLTWTLSGGTNPDDYDVNGTQGVVTHTNTNTLRYTTVDTGEADHRVRVTFELGASDLTGAGASVWVLGRFTDVNNYYAALISYNTSEVATIAIYKRVGGVLTGPLAGPVTISDTGVGGAGNDMMAELYIEGNRLYASCWRRFIGDEPITWMVSGTDDDLTTGNRAGMTGRRETGNTNTDLEIRYFDFLAVPGTVRFCGEVADWRPRRAPGGDRWVEVEAGDPLLRLQAPQADALRSALWREILLNDPIAFWPMTEGGNAVTAASALPGGAAMSITPDTDMEPRQINAWVEPILSPVAGSGAFYRGYIGQPDTDTAWAGDFVFAFDRDAVDNDLVVFWNTAPSAVASPELVQWTLGIYVLGSDDFLTYELVVVPFDGSLPVTLTSGTTSLKDGRLHHARIVTDNSGANTDWELFFDGTSFDSGTTTAPWSTLDNVSVDFDVGSGQLTAGFFAAWDSATPPTNAANAAVVGRSGELAGDRLARLFGEEEIAFELVGNAADTEAAGPQLIDTLANNAAACEAVDMGLLYGTRHQVGVTYRTRVNLYGQDPVTLDVDAGGEVAPPLEPVIGTLGVVNDVTVKRTGGSSARSVAEMGPRNVNPPHLDREGVGRYPVDLTVNADTDDQLQGLADWRRFRGTVKAVRYPQVTVLFGALASDGKTTLADSVNRLRIGDRVDLDSAEPTGVMQLVPGYAETIGSTVAEREITVNGTPANVYDIGIYNADDHKYDTAYSTTGASFVAGTDTSLTIAVEAGRSLWVTGSGSPQFPIDLNVLGCRLRVTAISGASSPQTATVNATVVNGINKTIPSGTPVRLWAPRRYAL